MKKYGSIFISLIIFCTVSGKNQIRHKRPKSPTSFSTIVLTNEKSEILLLRRKNSSFGNGLYSLPGGKIESGETASEAAVREAQEEIGIVVDQLELTHIIDRQGVDAEFYIFVFKPIIWHGNPSNCEMHKCDDIAWFSCNNLPENMIPAHRQAIDRSQKNILYSEHGW